MRRALIVLLAADSDANIQPRAAVDCGSAAVRAQGLIVLSVTNHAISLQENICAALLWLWLIWDRIVQKAAS